MGNHPSWTSCFASTTMGLWGQEGILDLSKFPGLGSYPGEGAQRERGRLTTAFWFFPGRTSAIYLEMPALCNCSLSHWSTILFCNTNNLHSVFSRAYEPFTHSNDVPLLPYLSHLLPWPYLQLHHYQNWYCLQNLHVKDATSCLPRPILLAH